MGTSLTEPEGDAWGVHSSGNPAPEKAAWHPSFFITTFSNTLVWQDFRISRNNKKMCFQNYTPSFLFKDGLFCFSLPVYRAVFPLFYYYTWFLSIIPRKRINFSNTLIGFLNIWQKIVILLCHPKNNTQVQAIPPSFIQCRYNFCRCNSNSIIM